MPLPDRIRECRTKAALSQAELAEKLHVSRQAVTKWEAGNGYPDITNLKAMATLFGVSVDYLLDETAPGTATGTVRHPIDVKSLEPYRAAGRPVGNRKHAAAKQVFPDATIWPLVRRHANTKLQEAIEWVALIVFDMPPGTFGAADGLENMDAYYLVEQKQRQLLARVSDDAVTSQELAPPVTRRRFAVGHDRFVRMKTKL